MKLIKILSIIICFLISIAFFTLAERKVIAAIQRRDGPNEIGFWGFLQPFSDGVKLIFKEIIIPSRSNYFLFLFSPILIMFLSMLNWCFLPFSFDVCLIDLDLSILIFLSISSISTYGIILAGWSSNSKYAFLGTLRAVAQFISYEIALGLLIFPLILISGSLNIYSIVIFQKRLWFLLPLLPLALMLFITVLAETNRTPFDLPEAEAELVAGFNVEYSSITFALFFLAEYSNIISTSILISSILIGGWQPMQVNMLFILLLCFFHFFLLYIVVYITKCIIEFVFTYLFFLIWKEIMEDSIPY